MEEDLAIAAQEKGIGRFLAMLPSKLLQDLAKTTDQKSHWDTHHSFQERLSKCWVAYFEGKNDPLRPQLNSGELAREEYNYIWRTTDFYLKLWGLIQISFDQIQQAIAKAEPGIASGSAYDLFCEILKEQADNSFSVCLEPYYEVSVSKLIRLRRLSKKIDSGKATPNDHRELAALFPEKLSCPLLWLVLKSCEAKAVKQERLMKERLKDIDVAIKRLGASAEAMRRGGGSYAWKNGMCLRAKKEGGVYTDA